MNNIMKRINVGAFSPKIQIANPKKNIETIKRLILNNLQVDVYLFPELSITGYSCGDLFLQSTLIDQSYQAIKDLVELSKNSELYNQNKLIVVGSPIKKDNQLFNCGVVISNGKILGIVPKTFMPNYNEFYEKRWFSSSNNRLSDTVTLFGEDIPFTPNLLFEGDTIPVSIAIEICEDLWMPNAPSSNHAIHGANLILNLSASNEVISKSEYRKNLVTMQSAKCIAAYAYASAGPQESTTDIVFSGHKLIASNGELLQENSFNSEQYEDCIYSTIDIEKLQNDRIKFNSFMGNVPREHYIHVPLIQKFYFSDVTKNDASYIKANPYPFVPKSKKDLENRCRNILNIQSTGLAQRMSTSLVFKPVIGISGGLDSTLALLVAIESMKKINKPLSNIIGITMPGFGTTNRTLDNSLRLMSLLGITMKNIDIQAACLQHFKDIEHDENEFNITYENVQARERTQILMDIANKEQGLVIGTGDMSELALGWCTYNGDHMSMYAVNSSIPKTLVKYLVMSIGEIYNKQEDENSKEIAKVLFDICDTPISPELLPKDKDGNMIQKTEESIGKYDVHDFILYNMIRNGYSPTKIYELAKEAFFGNIDEKTILRTMQTFYSRFFSQQFKRSCIPDGPKVGSVSLSPRGDWRMPSDACATIWLDELNQITIFNSNF